MRLNGQKAENLAASLLRFEGYVVDQAHAQRVYEWAADGSRRAVHAHDRFGCIDLVAVNVVGPTRLIQVTHPSGVAERKRKLGLKLGPVCRNPGVRVELWKWMGEGFAVEVLGPGLDGVHDSWTLIPGLARVVTQALMDQLDNSEDACPIV